MTKFCLIKSGVNQFAFQENRISFNVQYIWCSYSSFDEFNKTDLQKSSNVQWSTRNQWPKRNHLRVNYLLATRLIVIHKTQLYVRKWKKKTKRSSDRKHTWSHYNRVYKKISRYTITKNMIQQGVWVLGLFVFFFFCAIESVNYKTSFVLKERRTKKLLETTGNNTYTHKNYYIKPGLHDCFFFFNHSLQQKRN